VKAWHGMAWHAWHGMAWFLCSMRSRLGQLAMLA